MIIQSIFDTDHYKITMGQVIFHQFPKALAKYGFINRSKTPFPVGFAAKLQKHIETLADLKASDGEIQWLLKNVRYLKPTYLEWLAHYRFNPHEVEIRQRGGDLELEITGPWYRTVFWEVPLMALVSELFFQDRQPDENWQNRVKIKAEKMAGEGVYWADFGTRRRFSCEIQDKVNEIMKGFQPHFIGTSNPFFAMKYQLTPVGTYAHEAPMAMQVCAGLFNSNQAWMDAWVREYEGDLGIALPDTLTSKFFFQIFGRKEAKLFDGIRQDSGDPASVAEMAIANYRKWNIDPKSKRIIFSDGLTDDKLISLHQQFNDRIKVSGGIGTYLTNDVGHKPLNMVIKMTAANFGHGWIPVIKLSDHPGKYTGDPQRIAIAIADLGLDAMTDK